jgi:hypothetical protein
MAWGTTRRRPALLLLAMSMGGWILAPPMAADPGPGHAPRVHRQRLGGDACAAPSGTWGDVNDDGAVTIADAQQIARHSVGLSVANATAMAGRGDMNADARVSILDAQQIARHSVGLSAAARVNTEVRYPPAVVALTPGTAIVTMGDTVVLMAAPRDSTGRSLVGCHPATWRSSPTCAFATASPTATW